MLDGSSRTVGGPARLNPRGAAAVVVSSSVNGGRSSKSSFGARACPYLNGTSVDGEEPPFEASSGQWSVAGQGERPRDHRAARVVLKRCSIDRRKMPTLVDPRWDLTASV